MDPEIRNMLQQNLDLARENNEMLKKIRSIQKWQQVYRIAYWVVVLGISFGAYYYLQPYLEKVLSIYTGQASAMNGLSKSFSDVNYLNQLLEQFKK